MKQSDLQIRKPKKAVVINDLSGVGRCSLTVALPILSSMGIQCCPVPTAILSNQTEYPSYSFLDFTPYMKDYLTQWEKLQFQFDAIATGFLGSAAQIDLVMDYLAHNHFQTVLIDPVMGDHGELYSSYSNAMCEKMKDLISHATILTPNLTEACLLTNTAYEPEQFSYSTYHDMAAKLSSFGPEKIVITGIEKNEQVSNFVYEKNGTEKLYHFQKVRPSRPGTGDVFSSILLGALLNGLSFSEAVVKASMFISKCLSETALLNIPENEGVCFEQYLSSLSQPMNPNNE